MRGAGLRGAALRADTWVRPNVNAWGDGLRRWAKPYAVQLDRAGAPCSADNLCRYAAADLTRVREPTWKRMRDKAGH